MNFRWLALLCTAHYTAAEFWQLSLGCLHSEVDFAPLKTSLWKSCLAFHKENRIKHLWCTKFNMIHYTLKYIEITANKFLGHCSRSWHSLHCNTGTLTAVTRYCLHLFLQFAAFKQHFGTSICRNHKDNTVLNLWFRSGYENYNKNRLKLLTTTNFPASCFDNLAIADDDVMRVARLRNTCFMT